MKTKESINELLRNFQGKFPSAVFEEAAIVDDYQKSSDHQSLAIKILSVFGGILASLAFLGFLFIAGFYDSGIGMLTFGVLLIVAAVWISKLTDAIIMDTLSVSSYIIGFLLIGIAFDHFDIDVNFFAVLCIIIAVSTMAVVQNYILSFLATVVTNGSLLALIMVNEFYDLVHVHVAILGLVLTGLFLNEAKLIKKSKLWSKLYSPMRVGLLFSFLIGLIGLVVNGMIPINSKYIWTSSSVIILAVVYLVSVVLQVLEISNLQHRILIYLITLILLLPTVLSPGISGAILIVLLSFLVNYKTGFAIGVLAFIYFISRYYYDLNFTLLTKSILLSASGVFFMLLYLFTYKKLSSNEKV